MTILIDTNQFVRYRDLSGQHWRHLQRFVDRAPRIVVVPEIVQRESIARFRKDLENQVKELQKAHRRLRHMVNAVHPIPYDAKWLSAASDRYARTLDSRIRSLVAKSPALSTTSVEELVQRSIARRRPFGPEQRGLHDAIVWHVALDAMERGSLPFFIISEDRDFRNDDGLHPDLIEDVTDRGIDPGEVHLVRNLAEFTRLHILPELEVRNEWKKRLQSTVDFNEIVASRIDDVLDSLVLLAGDLEYETAGFVNATVVEIGPPEDLEIGDVFPLPENHLGVTLEFNTKVYFKVDYLGAKNTIVHDADADIVAHCGAWIELTKAGEVTSAELSAESWVRIQIQGEQTGTQ